jgi:dihydroorotate dehydrogenase electron transfer subunit
MYLRNAKIFFNKPVSVELYHMGLQCPDITARIQPGQFLMVRIQDRLDPLLRRPFAVHRLYPNDPPGSFEMLYKVVGRGTQLLTNMQAGDSVNLLGPLGRGFRLPEEKGSVLMVAGGIGIAPLPYLAETLAASGCKGPFVLWFGGKTSADLVCVQHFNDLGFAVQLVTKTAAKAEKVS